MGDEEKDEQRAAYRARAESVPERRRLNQQAEAAASAAACAAMALFLPSSKKPTPLKTTIDKGGDSDLETKAAAEAMRRKLQSGGIKIKWTDKKRGRTEVKPGEVGVLDWVAHSNHESLLTGRETASGTYKIDNNSPHAAGGAEVVMALIAAKPDTTHIRITSENPLQHAAAVQTVLTQCPHVTLDAKLSTKAPTGPMAWFQKEGDPLLAELLEINNERLRKTDSGDLNDMTAAQHHAALFAAIDKKYHDRSPAALADPTHYKTQKTALQERLLQEIATDPYAPRGQDKGHERVAALMDLASDDAPTRNWILNSNSIPRATVAKAAEALSKENAQNLLTDAKARQLRIVTLYQVSADAKTALLGNNLNNFLKAPSHPDGIKERADKELVFHAYQRATEIVKTIEQTYPGMAKRAGAAAEPKAGTTGGTLLRELKKEATMPRFAMGAVGRPEPGASAAAASFGRS